MLRGAYLRLIAALNAVGTAWIFVLLLLANADVLGRELFNAPVRGVTEIMALSIVGIVFLQLAHTLWTGRMTRSDSLLDKLAKRHPRGRAFLLFLFHAAGLVVMAFVCWACIGPFLEAWRSGDYIGAIGDFRAPTWPVRGLIVVGSALAAIAYALLAAADWARLAGRAGPPP